MLKFGRKFCKSIPTSPGIYRMFDSCGRVIYVGKAKNLNSRLRSYFYLRPETCSRKSIRLICDVELIKWEETETEREALLLENENIRSLQPTFNKINKGFETYPYQHLTVIQNTMVFKLDFSADAKSFDCVFGCFKSRGQAYKVQLALMRLLKFADRRVIKVFDLGGGYWKARFDLSHVIEFETLDATKLLPMVRRYYEGKSRQLCEYLEEVLLIRVSDTFLSQLVNKDLETLAEFYSNSCRYLKRVKVATGLKQKLISQDKIDDLQTNYLFRNF